MRDAFIETVRNLQAGNIAAAVSASHRLLRVAPDHPEALHVAGVVRYESGDDAGGADLLERAAALAPGNPEIPYNHGCALLKLNECEAAAERFRACLLLAPAHASAHNNLGTALQRCGEPNEAISHFRAALRHEPNHVGARVNLGQVELEREAFAAALPLFEGAVRLRPEHAGAWVGLGEANLGLGRLEDARSALERATGLDGKNPAAWRHLARARTEQVDFAGARDAARRVVELEPDSPDAWNNLASAWTSLGQLEPATEALDRAQALDPEHREARVNRAILMELSNRPEAALAIATAAATDPRLRLVRGKCLLRCGEPEAARAVLGELVDEARSDDPWLAKEALFVLGQLEDKDHRSDAAWAAFQEGNRIAEALWHRNEPAPDRFVPGLAGIGRVVAADEAWEVVAGPPRERSPAFLFGFQRSGTTLLDTVLGVHDQVVVLEEQPVVNRVIARMVERHGPYPEGLIDLSSGALEDLRSTYWREAAGFAEVPAGALLLDKSPLHTVHLALLRRLFPEAPLVLALRHPLDVCLSCFMQDFTMNAFMTHFTSIEGVARVYRDVFDLWFAAEAHVAGRAHVIRYETLVEDPETSLRALVDHLGLPWDDRLLDHTGAARARGLINTPSYEQVTRPIYRSASYRWKRYAAQLEPIREALAPYLHRLGYSD